MEDYTSDEEYKKALVAPAKRQQAERDAQVEEQKRLEEEQQVADALKEKEQEQDEWCKIKGVHFGTGTGTGTAAKKEDSQEQSQEEKIEEAVQNIMGRTVYKTIRSNDQRSTQLLFYNQSRGCYELGECHIREDLERNHPFFNSYSRREIIEHVKLRTGIDNDRVDSDINVINLENGSYYINEDKLVPHTPNYISMNQVPIKYKPRSPYFKQTRFMEFVTQVLYAHDIKTALEVMAYTFCRKNIFEVIVVLFGTAVDISSWTRGTSMRIESVSWGHLISPSFF